MCQIIRYPSWWDDVTKGGKRVVFVAQGTVALNYRINWYISPPYVARARQMPSLRRGLIAKGGL